MSEHSIRFTLNGRRAAVRVASDETVVEMLRERFDLFGARESCGQGLCGCCTVLIDRRPVSGCLTLAAFVDGAEIVTIEHLATGSGLDPIQQAFIESGAFQCGFCTPGFVLMTKALLDQHPDPGDEQIRHYLSGNLCRCGSYPQIVEAVKIAAHKRRAN
jgi:aerobic-type carbon monoxide dehydrogenase small subunit (CoxS/CutS family)